MSRRIKNVLLFGGAAAESDPLLEQAYWDNGDFTALQSFDDPRSFIIGRTGSGKSATLQHLEQDCPGKVIRIAPENLSLPYITNMDIFPHLLALGVHPDPFFKALWKHVILVEVLRHRYRITSREEKMRVLDGIMERIKSDPAKKRAVEYLNEFGDRFWCETDERVRQISDTFERKLSLAGGVNVMVGGVGLKASGSGAEKDTQTIQRETAAKYQRVVNEAQLPRLNDMIVILNNEILDSPVHRTYLVVDDLDKEWVDGQVANTLIRCLFQAVLDMQQVRNLKILVALRTNIFDQIGYGAQARGGQEEKFRALALYLHWTENDLRWLLKQRAEVANAVYKITPPRTLDDLLPRTHKHHGDPVRLIISRTLMRPRDAIQYLNECVRVAAGKDRISWDDVSSAEKAYSQERLRALRDEWKDPYFDIDKVFALFHGQPYRLSRPQMTVVLDDVALLTASDTFQGTPWLTTFCEQLWEVGSSKRTWYELYGTLVQLLYMIGFIGLVSSSQGVATYQHQEDILGQRASSMDENAYFEIHPAFHEALEIKQNL